MSYVPSFEHDIFVSYARVDNLTDPGMAEGWVMTLLRKLSNRLSQLLGRQDSFTLFFDTNQPQHSPIPPMLLAALERSATLLTILSPGYLESEWCRREQDVFQSHVSDRFQDDSRVFVVERDWVNRAVLSPRLANLGRYRFWEADALTGHRRILGRTDPNDPAYTDRLDHLARELADKLKMLRDSVKVGVPPSPPPAAATVFLAQVTDDLDAYREKVARYLEQRGYAVVPNVQTTYYPLDPDGFRAAVQRDMEEAKIFVQLLSRFVGRKPPLLEGGYVGYQHRYAVKRELPVLQWRPPELDPAVIESTVEDPAHRELLLGQSVHGIQFEVFNGEVVKQMEKLLASEKKRQQWGRGGDSMLVYIDYFLPEQDDREVAESISQCLRRRGVEVVTVPPEPADEGALREEMRYWLGDYPCKGAIVVQGRTSSLWVRRQLGEIHKINTKLPMALYQGPPPPKHPPGVLFHNMQLIDCVAGFDESRLDDFLTALQQED